MTASDYGAMLAYAQALGLEEACGLLGGEAGGQVRALYFIENIHHSAVFYEMHPTAQIRAMLEMEARGWELLGIFHSHPHGPAMPSETDVRLAYYPDALYVICAPAEAGKWNARAFTIRRGRVEEGEIRELED